MRVVAVEKMHRVSDEKVVLDGDGVVQRITVNHRTRRTEKKVYLYFKAFQSAENTSLFTSCSRLSLAMFHYACGELRDFTSEVYLFSNDALGFEALKSPAQFHRAIKSALDDRMIFKVKNHRYLVNPYLAAVGTDAQISDLRRLWDSLIREQEQLTNKETGK